MKLHLVGECLLLGGLGLLPRLIGNLLLLDRERCGLELLLRCHVLLVEQLRHRLVRVVPHDVALHLPECGVDPGPGPVGRVQGLDVLRFLLAELAEHALDVR